MRKIATVIHASPFITVTTDEMAEFSNVEQVSILIHFITDEFEVHEDFFVFIYSVLSIDTTMLLSAINYVFWWIFVLTNYGGQYYDGASAISRSKNSVAKYISDDIEPKALFAHCYSHALNLAASDTVKKLKIVKNSRNLAQEIAKLI